jgi:4,5-DOPA dioxygenase extradiol
MSDPTPAVFFGHGNPLNAVQDTPYAAGWVELGRALPQVRAIVSVSAHWYVSGTAVTAMNAPRTIHDFGGFPEELYRVSYPAPGDPQLAARIRDFLAPTPVVLDRDSWGLDHGTWSVLRRAFPHAQVPVVQLSVDETQPASHHYELGRRLAPLRDEGVLIVGSGNLVHNLHAYAWGRRAQSPYDWAVRFEQRARSLLEAGDDAALVAYARLGADARLAVPTPDHYLPLLYVLALRREGEPVSFPVEGVDGGSVSMLTLRLG